MKKSKSGILRLVVLFLLIVPGNLFTIRLFFGVDLIFGNIFVFLISFLYGPLWAILAGTVSSLTTYFIWNHCWVAPVFIAEALFISLFYRKKKSGTPVDYVSLFWLTLGFPLALLMYRKFLGLTWQFFLMTAVKQFLNSLFSASAAGLALSVPWLPLYKEKKKTLIPAYDLFSSLLIIFFICTIFSVLVLENRAFEKAALADMKNRIIHINTNFSTYLNDWKKKNLHILLRLSYQVAGYGVEEYSDELQSVMEFYSETLPGFDSLYVGNASGEAVAFAPRYSTEGAANIGRDYSDREYFSKIRKTLSPVFTSLLSAGDSKNTVVGIGVPVQVDGRFEGFVMGRSSLEPMGEVLREYQLTPYQDITLIDSKGKVIISTKDYAPMELFRSAEGGEKIPMGDGVLHWIPLGSPSVMQSYQQSYLYYKMIIPDLNWTIYAEESLDGQVGALIQKSFRNNLLALLFILILLPILKLLFLRFRKSLDLLLEVSSRHFDKGFRKEDWPKSRILEFNNLIYRMKTILEEQKENAWVMKEQNNKLSGMNAALVRSEENLRITLDSIGDGVIVTDAEGRVVTLNPVAMRLSGFTYDAAVNRGVESILNLREEYSGSVPPNPFVKVLRKGESLASGKPYVLEDLNGNISTVTLGAEPIRISQESEIRGTVIVIRNISETRRLETQLLQAQKMEVIGQLAGGIAHDFNNLLAGIVGLNEMIIHGLPKDSPIQESSQGISDLVTKAADLTRKLLAFSRKGKMTSKIFDLHELISDTAEILERTIDKSIRISKDFEAKTCHIAGDPTQIQSVFMNIALNASDAMAEGGSLVFHTITTKGLESVETATGIRVISGPHVCISISDTGSGIDKDALPHIFEPFFTTKGIGKGSGMGLPAVYGAISEHNGMIAVESELGRGSTFRIYFPLANAGKPLQKGVSFPEEGTREETILVVDDEGIIRSSLRIILAELGYNVLTAPGGEEGVKQYRENIGRISLVILDAVMTDMTGMEVLKILREINPLVRVIITTGYSSESREDMFRDAGAADFIPKPFTIDDLNSRIRRVLNR